MVNVAKGYDSAGPKLGSHDHVSSVVKTDDFEHAGHDVSLDSEANDDAMKEFKLTVMLARGNPFDSGKHLRMRSEYLDANLRISSFGRIREVDEEIFEIFRNEGDASTQDARLIRVRPRRDDSCRLYEDVGKFEKENDLVATEVGIENEVRGKASKDKIFLEDQVCWDGGCLTKTASSKEKEPADKPGLPIHESAPSSADERQISSDLMGESSARKMESEETEPEGLVTSSFCAAYVPSVAMNVRPGFLIKTWHRLSRIFSASKIGIWSERSTAV